MSGGQANQQPGGLPRIETVHLFPRLSEHLTELLRGLDNDDWSRPTLCKLWTVKDIAAHLLDGNLRRLSVQRDGHSLPPPEEPFAGLDGLLAWLNGLNAEWVAAAQRLSPRVLTGLLERTDAEVAELLGSLDPESPALWPVSWAGDAVSPNWFEIVREYTEKWIHQAQIRHAVGRPGLESRELYHPVLDAFCRALPHTYREVEAANGARVELHIEGEAGGSWFLLRESDAWRLEPQPGGSPTARALVGQSTAWKLFAKNLRPEDVADEIRLEGDEALARPALGMVAVMA